MITIAEQIECVDRELRIREKVYPRWVKSQKLTKVLAATELDRMRAVLGSLIKLYLAESCREFCPAWSRVMEIGLAHLGEELDRIVEDAT